jgi:hypothetical protein
VTVACAHHFHGIYCITFTETARASLTALSLRSYPCFDDIHAMMDCNYLLIFLLKSQSLPTPPLLYSLREYTTCLVLYLPIQPRTSSKAIRQDDAHPLSSTKGAFLILSRTDEHSAFAGFSKLLRSSNLLEGSTFCTCTCSLRTRGKVKANKQIEVLPSTTATTVDGLATTVHTAYWAIVHRMNCFILANCSCGSYTCCGVSTILATRAYVCNESHL